MKIEVIPYTSDNTEKKVQDKTVIVIDVLRATSVMVTALSNGAKQILPFISAEAAKQAANQFKTGEFLPIPIT